ncbi:MAG: VWA domain-containing protein [Chloroflexi bacterium]|nr:VWA domain-containing protein [Chloroflexota bacterium]
MSDYFLSNLLIFARVLRDAGVDVAMEQVSDLARILRVIGVASREDVRHAARALFVRRYADRAIFDRAFELFFRIQGFPTQAVIDPTQEPVRRVDRPKTIQHWAERETRRAENASSAQTPTDIATIKISSPSETLRQKHFDQFTEDEIRATRQLIAAMDWRIGERQTRRRKNSPRRGQVDFTRLMRQNLKFGAEIFQLPKRQPKFKPRSLIVLADVSGSMERYTRMILHLLHALSHAEFATNVEAFLFGTRLTRITPDLRRRNVDNALARVAQRVPDWSSGTRIGDALKRFNFAWARRVLRAGAVVLILSDGWDCGKLELLRDEMARLQRSCFRLMWLSPLVAADGARDATQGLQVALPFVDDFLSVYNLASLEMLVAKLETLTEVRALRRQHPRARIPAREEITLPRFMDVPQMGTSNYVRRTMTLQNVDGTPRFRYEDNSE